jgi:putative DNA methylase
MHLWWARRPLAACRAVLFASIVDDPSSRPDLFPTEADQDTERERLFRIIERLVTCDTRSIQRRRLNPTRSAAARP